MINKRINETIRNLLTDHSVKLDKDYYYPTEEEKLVEYLKVVDDLTINEENRLKRTVQELTVKQDKLDELAAQVASLTKMMGGRFEPRNKNGTRLEHLTEELSENLDYIDYCEGEERFCCRCGIQYYQDDDSEKEDWYVINKNGDGHPFRYVDGYRDENGHKRMFECHRCHTAKKRLSL